MVKIAKIIFKMKAKKIDTQQQYRSEKKIQPNSARLYHDPAKTKLAVPKSGMNIAFQMLYRLQVCENGFGHQVIDGYDAA